MCTQCQQSWCVIMIAALALHGEGNTNEQEGSIAHTLAQQPPQLE
jgi:hypothetical protein